MEDGSYSFCTTHFNEAIKEYKNNASCTKKEVYEKLADKVNVSPEAVKKWGQGHNGPSDLELIRQIAIFFDHDVKYLLAREVTEDKIMITSVNANYMAATEKEVITTVYKQLIGLGIYRLEMFKKPSFYEGKEVLSDWEKEKIAKQLYVELMKYIDENSLVVSMETWEKLRVITSEVDFYAAGESAFPRKWYRANPILDDAQVLYNMSEGRIDFDLEERKEMRDNTASSYAERIASDRKYIFKTKKAETLIYDERGIDSSGRVFSYTRCNEELIAIFSGDTSREAVLQTLSKLVGDEVTWADCTSVHRTDDMFDDYIANEEYIYFFRFHFIKALKTLFEEMFGMFSNISAQ